MAMNWKTALICLPLFTLAACTGTKDNIQTADSGQEIVSGTTSSETVSSGEQTPGADQGDSAQVAQANAAQREAQLQAQQQFEEEKALRQRRVYYFSFDGYDVSDEDVAALAAHGRFLVNNPNAHMRVEGYADERGTREYNIGLGERRAKAVKQVLQLYGAGAGQLDLVSFGEERPATRGHDASAWAKNRRVELVYE
ncbi:peptidoglycan-associated lipoprotein Pal [Pelagibaculum spongiae]|uniref:Peptidoglycan-associated lipoprotein n=1 Tax=Pelagibaculum spongiae TaxID=2080658 RepID=A0A2V1GUS7_9GAMM|nr:peptidoglycan-associated lipoprotein Pal [Pelagibaculum spongiae]PVZ69441.1 peptidoglycan-associated lipoprotein Pal [Pelagibaculum spongiae]